MKKSILTILTLSLSSSLLTACGGGDGDLPLPPSVEAFVQANQTPSAGGNTLANQSEQNKKLDKIIESLDDIKGILQRGGGVSVGGGGGVSTGGGSSSSGGSEVSTPTEDSGLPADVAPETPGTEAPAQKEEVDILGKIVDVLTNSPGITINLKKTERNLKTGKMTSRDTLMITNQSKVKVEVTSGDKKGTKLVYNVGAAKVGVRPNGGLSWVTTELAQNDDRITSTNGYTLLQTDLAALSNRMGGPGYSAKLIGKTTIGGETVHVVKVTTSGTNALEASITHEHIAYNPDNYSVKYWEAYVNNEKTPYMRYLMTSFQIGPVPASAFKL